MSRNICLVLLTLGLASGGAWAVPAFSGAEGFGAVTSGGSGGTVYHVTNLNNSGTGSFRAACEAGGTRTVVFDVSGQINLVTELNITNPYLTIAGQTAPGQGITIAGETTSLDTHDIIVRYIRFRRGATDYARRDDALGSDRTTGSIIIDHVSASWGLDENMSIYRNRLDVPLLPNGSTVLPTRNVTIQWSISSEALNINDHAFGSTVGGVACNYHHNLWASNTSRNPSISFSHFLDFRNNVMFNWLGRNMDGAGEEAHVNVINNYYKPGPATQAGELQYRVVKPEIRGGTVGYGKAGWWYVEGNYVDGNATVTANNWNGGVQYEIAGMQESWARSTTMFTHIDPFDDVDDPNDDVNGVPIPIQYLPTIATQTAQNAYQSVLAGAGSSLTRDAVDSRIVDTVTTGQATLGPDHNGIIDTIADANGYPTIPFVQRDANYDTDRDGMPNTWETARGLNPNDANDRNGDYDNDGFNNLQEFLNEAGAFKAVQDVNWNVTTGRYALIENWDIMFQPSRLDTVNVNSGTVAVDAIDQHAGTLRLANTAGGAAELAVTAGQLAVEGAVHAGSASGARGTATISGGLLSVGGSVALGGGGGGAGGLLIVSGGSLTASNAVLLAPAASSTGELRVSKGAYVQAQGLTMSSGSGRVAKVGLELDSAGASLIHATGSSTLAGTLDVQSLSDYRPREGDAFTIIDSSDPSATYTGSFADVTSNITRGLQAGLDPFGGRTSGEDYEIVFQGLTYGDASGDHNVNSGDLSLMTGAWAQTSGAAWADGDFTGDGAVNSGDLSLLTGSWGWTLPSPAPGETIPEPASLCLLALSGLALLRRRRA